MPSAWLVWPGEGEQLNRYGALKHRRPFGAVFDSAIVLFWLEAEPLTLKGAEVRNVCLLEETSALRAITPCRLRVVSGPTAASNIRKR